MLQKFCLHLKSFKFILALWELYHRSHKVTYIWNRCKWDIPAANCLQEGLRNDIIHISNIVKPLGGVYYLFHAKEFKILLHKAVDFYGCCADLPVPDTSTMFYNVSKYQNITVHSTVNVFHLLLNVPSLYMF